MINAVTDPSVILALQWHNHLTHLMSTVSVYILNVGNGHEGILKSISDDQDTVVKILDEVFELVGRETRSDNGNPPSFKKNRDYLHRAN